MVTLVKYILRSTTRKTLIKNYSIILILVVFFWGSGCVSKSTRGFVPQAGDLLFQDLDGSPFYEAIEKVTEGYKGADLTHIGLVAINPDGSIVVLEASLEGVCVAHLDVFLNRSLNRNGRPKVLVGRLKPEYRHLIQPAITQALALKGKSYDNLFDVQNDAYYCSELIYQCFQKANDNKPLFKLQPMTFVDPDTGETFPVWKEYFTGLGTPVPEGKPGINPGTISRSKIIDIIYFYSPPETWKKFR